LNPFQNLNDIWSWQLSEAKINEVIHIHVFRNSLAAIDVVGFEFADIMGGEDGLKCVIVALLS
jgi:hypothetical protein